MRPLSDYFTPHIVHGISERHGMDYVEQAQTLTDKQLLQCRGVGVAMIRKLRALPPGELKPVPRYAIAKAYDELKRATWELKGSMRRYDEAVKAFNEAAVEYSKPLK